MDGLDLVHDHTLAGPLYRHRPDQTPIIATAHGPLTGELDGIYQAITLQASLIAISHHQANAAPDLRISRLIHHGIDAHKAPVGRGEGGYACFLGRMNPDKGLLQAIGTARVAGMPLRIAAKMTSRDEHEYFCAVIAPAARTRRGVPGRAEHHGQIRTSGRRRGAAEAHSMARNLRHGHG
jgi:hypothetical protein